MTYNASEVSIMCMNIKKKLSPEIFDYIDMKYVYILRSLVLPEHLYIGVSDDVLMRLNHHNEGKCLHTSKFRPWRVVHTEEYAVKEEAFSRERQLKRWSRGKKEALVAGDKQRLKQLSKRK